MTKEPVIEWSCPTCVRTVYGKDQEYCPVCNGVLIPEAS